MKFHFKYGTYIYLFENAQSAGKTYTWDLVSHNTATRVIFHFINWIQKIVKPSLVSFLRITGRQTHTFILTILEKIVRYQIVRTSLIALLKKPGRETTFFFYLALKGQYSIGGDENWTFKFLQDTNKIRMKQYRAYPLKRNSKFVW